MSQKYIVNEELIVSNVIESFKACLSKSGVVDVSIIIVNWNSREYLKNTIISLYKHTNDINFEVIVIDNNSVKNSPSLNYINTELAGYDNVKIILNRKNLGFAKANNVGMDISLGKYVLLLNPDTVLQNNMVKILCDYLDNNPDVGMVGPKVLNPDGSFQASCMRGEPYPLDVFFTLSGLSQKYKNNPKFNKFSLYHLDNNEINDVAGLSGCCMMVRKEVIEQVGKMDEQFFLYQEETDWCWRAQKAGWKLVYNPNAVITHEKGQSTKQKILKTNYVFCASMMKFFIKHHFKRYNYAQKAAFMILIWGNFFVRYAKIYVHLKMISPKL